MHKFRERWHDWLPVWKAANAQVWWALKGDDRKLRNATRRMKYHHKKFIRKYL